MCTSSSLTAATRAAVSSGVMSCAELSTMSRLSGIWPAAAATTPASFSWRERAFDVSTAANTTRRAIRARPVTYRPIGRFGTSSIESSGGTVAAVRDRARASARSSAMRHL